MYIYIYVGETFVYYLSSLLIFIIFKYKKTNLIQKLGHHAPNLCFVGERNSEHGFFELRWNLPIGQKEQEPSRMEYIDYN